MPTRYDGGHRLDKFLLDALGGQFDFLPVCPEAEAWFGVPRETVKLEGNPEHPQMITSVTRRNLTEAMESWIRKRLAQLEKEKLAGFIFKARSPSCGLYGTNVGVKSAGLFARAFMERFPGVPVEEDERLRDDAARAAFVARALSVAGR